MALYPIQERLKEQELGLLVESDGKVLLKSDREGLTALCYMHKHHPELLDGSDVALPVVGLAAAYVLILSNAGRVFTWLMSHEARAALNEEGIEHASNSNTKKIPEKYAGPSATLDAQARLAVTPQAFVEELRRTIE